jgi:hypothetical protein
MPLLLTPLAGAIVYVFGRSSKARMNPAELRKLLWRAGVSIAVGVVLISVYALCLDFWTVTPPRESSRRYQIGFGSSASGLTEHGRELRSKYPGFTAQEMVLADAGFVPGGPERIWTTGSVVSAGSLLIILYLLALSFWSAGFGLLRRHQAALGESQERPG